MCCSIAIITFQLSGCRSLIRRHRSGVKHSYMGFSCNTIYLCLKKFKKGTLVMFDWGTANFLHNIFDYIFLRILALSPLFSTCEAPLSLNFGLRTHFDKSWHSPVSLCIRLKDCRQSLSPQTGHWQSGHLGTRGTAELAFSSPDSLIALGLATNAIA